MEDSLSYGKVKVGDLIDIYAVKASLMNHPLILVMARFIETGSDLLVSARDLTLLDKINAEVEMLRNAESNTIRQYVEMITLADTPMLHVLITWFLMVSILFLTFSIAAGPDKSDENLDEPDENHSVQLTQRDFTIPQLRSFDGSDPEKPIYVSLKGVVYDVSSASNLYGKGNAYNCMAGREASRAMAKLSFEETDLSNTRLDDLGAFERGTLDDWVEKFQHYKSYPIVGRCPLVPAFDSVSDSLPIFTREELKAFKGYQEIPDGRVNAPIYLAINGKVLDVSFGGVEMYGKGGPYHIFAGIDASRALAKMSFEQEDVESVDLSDLTEEQKKTLDEVCCYLICWFLSPTRIH